MSSIERIQSRLENIQSAEPLLAAMRTISMGSWERALKQRNSINIYTQQLGEFYYHLIDRISEKKISQKTTSKQKKPRAQKTILLVIGSERGLCGVFNRILYHSVAQYLERQKHREEDIEIWALGSRIIKYLQNDSQSLFWSAPLPITILPPFSIVRQLIQEWLSKYKSRQIDRITVLYNTPTSGSSYRQEFVQLFPPHLPNFHSRGTDLLWPPPILETNPIIMLLQIIEQITQIRLYSYLLESATSEHAARYQLMDDATQNAARLVDELKQELIMARRQEITGEIQALAVGAGLIRNMSHK